MCNNLKKTLQFEDIIVCQNHYLETREGDISPNCVCVCGDPFGVIYRYVSFNLFVTRRTLSLSTILSEL